MISEIYSLSDLDIDKMSPEDIKFHAEKFKSRSFSKLNLNKMHSQPQSQYDEGCFTCLDFNLNSYSKHTNEEVLSAKSSRVSGNTYSKSMSMKSSDAQVKRGCSFSGVNSTSTGIVSQSTNSCTRFI